MQQYRGISKKLCSTSHTSAPNPRRQFILDLQAWLEELVRKGHSIIQSMDSNEEHANSKGNFCPLQYNPEEVISYKQHDGSLSTPLTPVASLISYKHIILTKRPPLITEEGSD